MNTKSSEISSELVAVAWMNPDEDMSDEAFSWATDTSTGHVLAVVRLSDAEAVIAAKDAELAAWKNDAINGGNAGYLREQVAQKAERIKELESELEESDAILDRCAHLLAETAVALKGPEKALHRHGWQDLPEVAAKQSAALKLAREKLLAAALHVKPTCFDLYGLMFSVHFIGWCLEPESSTTYLSHLYRSRSD